MTNRLSLLILSILVLALAGCGSSDNKSGDSNGAAAPEPLTKTELIAQADAICQDMQDRIDKIPSPETIDELASSIDKQIAVAGPAIDKLEALTPPEDLASDYEAWTAKLEELQAGTERIRTAAEGGSQSEVENVVEEVSGVNDEADEIGKKIGFKVCAD